MSETTRGLEHSPENSKVTYHVSEIIKPDYQTERGYENSGFQFSKDARYFSLNKESPTNDGSKIDGQGIVEYKKNSSGTYIARYVTFKQHGSHDYRAYENLPIPNTYTQKVKNILSTLQAAENTHQNKKEDQNNSAEKLLQENDI